MDLDAISAVALPDDEVVSKEAQSVAAEQPDEQEDKKHPQVGRVLRAEAKAFVPHQAPSYSELPINAPFVPVMPFAPVVPVTVSESVVDEEGNVVYPSRVSAVQDPEYQRLVAARDYQLGFRSRKVHYNTPSHLLSPSYPQGPDFAVFQDAPTPSGTHTRIVPVVPVEPATVALVAPALLAPPMVTLPVSGKSSLPAYPTYNPLAASVPFEPAHTHDDGADDPTHRLLDDLKKLTADLDDPVEVPPVASATGAEPMLRTEVLFSLRETPAAASPSASAVGPIGPQRSSTGRGIHQQRFVPPPPPYVVPPPGFPAAVIAPALPLYPTVVAAVQQPPAAPLGAPPPHVAAASTFVPNAAAKPWVPPSTSKWDTPSSGTDASNDFSQESLSSVSVADERPLDALRVNAETFFSSDTTLSTSSPSNPFSLQSLQGVRRQECTMPLQQVVWQRAYIQDAETWVPPPFPPIADETVRLFNGSKHYDVTRPLTHPHIPLHLYQYRCMSCPIDVYPGKINERPADVKLGGVCGDVPALCIAHLIEVITGVKILAVDIFGHNLGRCNLWLANPRQVAELTSKFDRRMWMSPVVHGYAVVAPSEEGREYLLWYLESLRKYGPKSVRFPRHLVTCEKWIA